jgi:hypothetical protein
MASKNSKPRKTYAYLEQWDTRYGKSDRVVIREQGRFVDTISLSALRKGQKVTSR